MKTIIITVHFNVLAVPLHYKNYPGRNCIFAAVHYRSCPRIHGILKYNNYSVERYVTFYWTILYEDNDI